MTSSISIFAQVLAIILQVLNSVNVSQLPVKWQAAVTGAITILQAIMAIVAHYYTPSGIKITPGATIQTKEAAEPQSARAA